MNNTEKFFIQFVFKDQKIMGELKKLAASIDKVIRASERQAASSKKTSQEQKKAATEATKAQETATRLQKKLDDLKAKSAQESTKKIKSLQQAQIAMLQQITRAYSRGLDSSARYYERIVDKEKDVQRMMRLTQNLREKIERDRLASSKTSRTAESKQAMSERLRQERLRDKVDLFAHGLKRSAQYESLNARGRTEFDQAVRNAMREVKTTKQLNMAKKDLTSTLRQLSGATKQAERRLFSLRTVQRGLTNSTRNMIHAYASLFAIFSGVKSINSVGQGFEAMESSMFAATESIPLAAEQIQFLDKLTSRLGISLLDTAEAYAKLAVSARDGMTFDQIQELFTGLTEFGTVMGVSKDKMKWAMMAVTQIANKGVVSMEEVRRQLSESLPGSFQVAAKAMGMTTAEFTAMVESGQLASADFLPKFGIALRDAANSAGALEQKYKTTRVAQGRFFKQLETAQNTIFKGGMDEGGAVLFNQLAKGLDESEHGLKSFGKVFKTIFKTVAGLAKVLMPILSDLATIVGTLAQGLMTIFGSTTGRIFVGMIAFNRVIKALNTSTGRLAMNWAAVLGTITEIIALFTRGYVGVTELALGGDLALGEMEVFQKLGEIFNDDGLMGEASRTIITYLPLILVALAAIRTAVLSYGWIKDLVSKIGKGADKTAKTTSKTDTKTGTAKTTPTGKKIRLSGANNPPSTSPSGVNPTLMRTIGGVLLKGLGAIAGAYEVYKGVSNSALAGLITGQEYSAWLKQNDPLMYSLMEKTRQQSISVDKMENTIVVPEGTSREQAQFLYDELNRIMLNNAVQ